MSKPSTITVSRSKRGTTIKASGAAAQALFDALAGPGTARKALARPGPHTVHFEDHGQDFLEWDIDAAGMVTDSRPLQANVWRGAVLVNDAKPGGTVTYISPRDRAEHTVRYPVFKVVAQLAAGQREGTP